MAIKVQVDKIDEVEEGYRGLYTESDGKFVLTGVDNILDHPSVRKLKDENGQRRISERKATDKLKTYEILGDRKPEDILATLDRVPELETLAAGKLDEKKVEELVNGRLTIKLAPVQRELDGAKKLIADRDVIIADFQKKETTRSIHDAVREAVTKAQGFNASAMEDALMFAERHLTVDEDGKVTTKEDVGVTPGVDAVVWLSEMQQRKPHWWGTTTGGGGGGNRGTGGGGGIVNPWMNDTWNMTEQGKIVQTNPTRAAQLAAAAGTKVGGLRPAAKKN